MAATKNLFAIAGVAFIVALLGGSQTAATGDLLALQGQYKNTQYQYKLALVAVTICIGPPGSPGSFPVEIPIEKSRKCTDIETGEDGTDRIVIEAAFDVLDEYPSLNRLFDGFCKMPELKSRSSEISLGKRLPAISCSGEYGAHRWKKVVATTRQDPGNIDRIVYKISAYSHISDKQQAEAALSTVLNAFILTYPR